MENIIYTVFTVKPYSEELLALFTLLPFDSFEEKDDSFDAYIDQSLVDAPLIDEVEQYVNQYGASYELSTMENQNWNEIWESNFSPVEVDDFVRIRADFHESKNGFIYEIVIQPKMAFGTGHHQTTHMMVQAMRNIDFSNKKVLDYGCGTGILAIVAEKLGAHEVIGVDNEYPSYENTIDNALKNRCYYIKSIHGIIDDVPQQKYDIILANINRNVLLDSADKIFNLLSESGILLLSGILLDDYDVIMQKYNTALSLPLVESYKRDQWMCLHFTK